MLIASYQVRAAPSIAHQNLGQIVSSHETREDKISFPALAETIVLVAPDTAGPWSARSINIVLIYARA